ncbi:aldo/keto reductase [Mucilaginibacter myungsuensis]|uniref:Aldo/keto reductase n=1 Tax=Mucilaginibacter myungsuensis TaxID=649104 RepID=A0A929KU08_9SPHI|nr:aldo/keto reductase [Mucilaginibacter myungsuensis]MBE9660400.1 aldo/keto reductase [Mucilaginibacter myungsuensis]MDN3600443.1 aldo/keto reductase [Mucilaginibacter myungsuensis]
MNNIGFGCSKLTSNFSKKQAIRNLEVAFDNGITHFDVARLYGQGLAESILGDFVRDKRSKVTITTKVGLFPNGGFLLNNLFLQNVAKIAYQQLKKVGPTKLTNTLADSSVISDLSVERVRGSIHTSLRELNTPYIDFLLLHEATIGQTNDAELIALLDDHRKNGLIKNYGIASYGDKIKDELYLLPSSFTVLQTDSSYPTQKDLDPAGRSIEHNFYFSPFLHLKKVSSLLAADKDLTRSVSDLLNFDATEHVLDVFLIQQNMNTNDGTFLFTTSDNKKIQHTVDRWRHVQTLTVTPENFEKAKTLINTKL